MLDNDGLPAFAAVLVERLDLLRIDPAELCPVRQIQFAHL